MASKPSTIAQYLLVIRRTINVWDGQGQRSMTVPTERANANVPTIYALTAQTVELARAIDVLYRQGLWLAAMPTIRSAMECAVTAVWLGLVPSKTNTFIYQSAHERGVALREIAAAGNDVSAALAQTDATKSELLPSRDDKGVRIRARFEDLVGGVTLHTSYRIASSLSHPSTTMVDRYLVVAEDKSRNPLGMAFRANGEWDERAATAWLGVAATMLVRAMIALDSALLEPRMRTQLEQLSEQLGIAFEVGLAGDAQDHGDADA